MLSASAIKYLEEHGFGCNEDKTCEIKGVCSGCTYVIVGRLPMEEFVAYEKNHPELYYTIKNLIAYEPLKKPFKKVFVEITSGPRLGLMSVEFWDWIGRVPDDKKVEITAKVLD